MGLLASRDDVSINVRPLLRFLFRYVGRNVPQYALGGLMLLATNYAVVRIPALIGDALNLLESGGAAALRQSRGLAIELLVWGIALVIVRTLSRVLFFNPGRDVEFRLGLDLFERLLGFPRPFYAKRKIGELVSLASNDTTAVRLLVGFAGLQLCNVAVATPMHLYQMYRTDPVLTAWCLVPVAAGGIYMRSTVRRFYGMVRTSMQELASLSDRVLESYAGIGTIRSHCAESAVFERFGIQNDRYLALQLRIAAIRAFSMPVLGLSGLVGSGLVLWVGGERVVQGHMQVGSLATFLGLLTSLVAILMSLAWVMAAVPRGIVSYRRIDEIFEMPDGLPIPDRECTLDSPPRIDLRDLSFRYPDQERPALEGISATVEPGRTLGIFGHTGAGKTTLVNLLAGVQTPPRGSIFFAGEDASRVPLKALRQAIAVVPQDPFLFSSTVRENIRFSSTVDAAGDEARLLDDAELAWVIQAAALQEDLAQLSQGLDTIVGERGVTLSGGQKQRIALARALYQERHVLLLDDVLSAVDQRTEQHLVKAIRALRTGHGGHGPPTTVIVSHRTSVLEHADEILVLEQGRILERGTHVQLLAKGGLYASTHAHQEATHE